MKEVGPTILELTWILCRHKLFYLSVHYNKKINSCILVGTYF